MGGGSGRTPPWGTRGGRESGACREPTMHTPMGIPKQTPMETSMDNPMETPMETPTPTPTRHPDTDPTPRPPTPPEKVFFGLPEADGVIYL